MVGLGYIGPVHIQAIRATGLAEVIAVSHSTLDVAEAKAREMGIPKAYGDYRELLADPKVEAVHICTPNALHHDIAKGAMLAGKHVVCEKPLAIGMEDARELADIADRTGIVNAINFCIRYYPLLHQARDMVQSGVLGEILSVSGSYHQDWMLYDSDYNWRVEPEHAGPSRVIGDIGSHWFDCVEFVTGACVEQLCADIAIFHRTRKKPLQHVQTFQSKETYVADNECERVGVRTEDYASAVFRMDNGAHGTVSLSQCAAGRKNRMLVEVYGSKKSLCFDSERPGELWMGNRDKPNEMLLRDPSLMTMSAREISHLPGGHVEGYEDTMRQLFRAVYGHILEGKDRIRESVNYPTFADGLRAMTICNAVLRSQKQMSWISV